VTVTFDPQTSGTLTDTVTITSTTSPILPGGTGSGPYSDVVSFTGVGVSTGEFTATSVAHNWGNIPVNTSGGDYGVELSNNSASIVTLSFPGLTGSSEFSLVASSCGASLAVNANCELIFAFNPTASGAVSATYPITANATLYTGGNPVSPAQISLSGTGQ
jgi:hypothetical protein